MLFRVLKRYPIVILIKQTLIVTKRFLIRIK